MAPVDSESMYRSLTHAWHEAAERAEHVETIDLALADSLLRLRVADRALAECIKPAFAHLQTEANGRAVNGEFLIWSSKASGVPLPQLPRIPLMLQRDHLAALSTDEIKFYYRLSARVFSALHLPEQRAVCCIDDPNTLPAFERGSPLRGPLSAWLRSQGTHMVHAAGLGKADRGVLIAGRSGLGKSTLALSSLQSDLDFAGDDYLAVRFESDGPRAFSVYCSGKLAPHHRERFPFLSRFVAPWELQDGEKSVMILYPDHAARLLSTFAIRGIIVPRVTEGESKLTPLPKAAAFAAVAPSTLLQNAVGGQDDLEQLKKLVSAVPTYLLEVGSSLPNALRRIEALLAGESNG